MHLCFCCALFPDNVDTLLDRMVGDDGASVGKSIVAYLSKIVRKVPFPDNVDQLKRP
jgi:hypothetical protein